MNNPVLKFEPPRGLVLWWWIASHNLDVFTNLMAFEVYKLTDRLNVLFLKATGRYTVDYHVKKRFAGKSTVGSEMWLIIAHLLTKLRVHPHDSRGLHIAGAFQPQQLTLYCADPYGLQWIAFLRHLRTMEDIFDGLVWMKVTTHIELEEALGYDEYETLLPMSVPQALKHIRPQVEEKQE